MANDNGVKRISQMQRSKVLDDGNVHEVVEVSFYVDNQGPFTIDVPKDSYEVEIVRRMVEDFARRVRATKQVLEG